MLTHAFPSIALQNVLPENTIYFIPYSLANSPLANDGVSATTLVAQINAINLALTLEMFLPQSTRVKFPMLTTHIPFIDAASKVDGAALIASSQSDERSYSKSAFGMPQSQSQSQTMMHSGFSQSHPDLTREQMIDLLTLPLAELKSVYLRLCARRKEKHVLYVLRRVILEICCIVSPSLLLSPSPLSLSHCLLLYSTPLIINALPKHLSGLLQVTWSGVENSAPPFFKTPH
jgi:hypothetical protein